MAKAIALYEYDATQDGHVSLRVGDVISVMRQDDSGWWSGVVEHSQQAGWFPASFVELTTKALGTVGAEESSAVATGHPDWWQYTADDGSPYYYNTKTNETSWSLPNAAQLNKVVSPPGSFIESPFLNDNDENDQPSQFLHHIPLSKLNRGKKPIERTKSNASQFSKLSLDDPSRIPPSPLPSLKQLSFVDPAPTPQLVDGRYGYAQNFISDTAKSNGSQPQSGFDILVLKHRNGKEMCKDVSQFMAERARIEDQYAKQLIELAKSQYGSMESGTLKTAWNQLKFDVECQSKSRQHFASQLAKEVHAPTMHFKDRQKKTRKDYEVTIANDRKQLLDRYKKAQRAQQLYLNKCREAEMADAMVARGQLPNQTKRDFLKVDEVARRERKKASILAFDYRAAVKDFEDVRVQWNEDFASATQEFEAAEVERIDFLKGVLQTYLGTQRDVNDQCKESSEMCANSIESVSSAIDIELFVKSKFTGCVKVEPLTFEQYKEYI